MPIFDTPLNTNDQSVDRVIAAGLPVVLVIARGSLSGALEDTLKQIAKAHAGDLLVAKLDAAENPATAAQASGTLPALLAYQNGEVVAQANGIDPAAIRAHADFVLGRGPRPAATQTAPPRSSNGRSAQSASGGSSNATGTPVVITDASFEREVVNSDIPVLVDLWAPWCGPCRMIGPIVEKIARDYAGRLKVAKLNVDENPQTSMRYQVQGIPTLLIFRNGRVADRIVGASPEPVLRGHVDKVLRGG